MAFDVPIIVRKSRANINMSTDAGKEPLFHVQSYAGKEPLVHAQTDAGKETLFHVQSDAGNKPLFHVQFNLDFLYPLYILQ